MDAEIEANVPLDYIEFHIFPSENRYEAYACYLNKIEKVTSGLLGPLLVHSAEVKALHSKGSDAEFKLESPENHDMKWFTKFTLMRFLNIIGSTNILKVTNSVKNEISQLEEARKFHLSLYAKGTDYQQRTGDSGNSYSNRTGLTDEAEASDASKNELLKAIDLRLTALKGERIAAFDQVAGSKYSMEEMTDLEKFSHHFGSIDLRDSLREYLELRQENLALDNSSNKLIMENVRVTEENHTPKLVRSETPVKYGVSPAKAAQVERQSSTESDESSFSSEEEQPFTDRSRTLLRSASPRRSASPMRRVQIGRSGSRRSTAIAIKSLNYFPGRGEKSLFPDEEVSQQAPRKSESNVTRISVQDAISLFERKQKDQTVVDVQKAKPSSSLNANMVANNTVLRIWSNGMGEDSSQSPENNNLESRDIANSSPEAECECVVASEDHHAESCEKITEATNASEKLTATAEWSRKKEAELNELLIKMMETKPAKNRAVVTDSRKRQSLPSEQRGGFYDHHKEKRDENHGGESIRKKFEKDKKPLRVTEQVRKSEPTLANARDTGKRNIVKNLQKPGKNISQPANRKTESPKPSVIKKATPKVPSLPSTRKSWPSTLPTKTLEKSTAKKPTPIVSSATNTNPPRRKSLPIPLVSRSSPKVETSQPRAKSVKSNQNDSKTSLKRSTTEKKQQILTKSTKTLKSKVQTAPKDLASLTKPSLYSKVTKKGTVVPLESKPFLRKGSKTISNVNPVTKIKKTSPTPEEPLTSSEQLFLADENEAVSNLSDPVVQPEERDTEALEIHWGIESEIPETCEDGFISQADPTIIHNIDKLVDEPDLKAEAEEESMISPMTWVEIEEHEETAQVGVSNSNTRVRHSLSQMLLEEISTQDNAIDWGNAENPPPVMVYQKDAPKGLKRLLKFARKGKTDANSTGWSSPSVFSEGEDDTEDLKNVSRRSSDSLLKKATLQSKNNGTTYKNYQNNATDYEHPAQPNISKFGAQSLSQHLQEGHLSASVTTSKATRSFFSLSAFKGGK